MGTYEFRKFSHYNPEPKEIRRLQFNPTNYKLALSRSNNTLEIWDVRHTPHLDRTIIVDKDDSIESIAWCDERLFSAGIGCSVLEHDLLTASVKPNKCITTGVCWCIDVSPDKTLLAAGTESGYIHIIRIYEDTLEMEKSMDRQQGEILCIGWEQSGKFLATGSVDAVRIWNVERGEAIHKLTPGRSQRNDPTVIWCLTIADDFTVITGDSRGIVTFWDGDKGLFIDSHQSHKAPILSVCLNKEKTKLYCAGRLPSTYVVVLTNSHKKLVVGFVLDVLRNIRGMDPLIASFERINVRGSGNAMDNYQWIKSIQRIIHDHEVRALTMCDEKLFSAGIDGYLALSSYPPKVLIKYSPMLQSKRICSAHEAKILLIAYNEHLEIWHWSPKVTLTHVAMIKSYKNEYIRSSSISPDGSWIVYSTDHVARLLHFSAVKNTTRMEINKVGGLPEELKSTAIISFCFSSDSKYLAAADKNRKITIVELRHDESIRLIGVLNAEPEVLTDIIHIIDISESNEFVVAADRSSNIAVWKNFEYHSSLPKYSCAPTAMSINCNNKCVVVSYADHRIVEYNLNKKRYTSFSRMLHQKHPKQWLNRQFPVDGILFDRDNPNVIMIYDDTTICIIDKTKKLPEVGCKIPRLDAIKSPDNSDTSESSSSQISLNRLDNVAFHVLKEFKHLVHLSAFGGHEMLVVEVNPDTLTRKLPTLLLRKRFGKM